MEHAAQDSGGVTVSGSVQTVQMWCLGTGVSGEPGSAGLSAELHDLRGFFQSFPVILSLSD